MDSSREVAEALWGMSFPATKAECVEFARRRGVAPEVLDGLQKMPEKPYDSFVDVVKAIGKVQTVSIPVSVLAETLRGIRFPATKAQCIEYAKKHEPPTEVLTVIQSMPEKPYDRLADVLGAMGHEEIAH